MAVNNPRIILVHCTAVSHRVSRDQFVSVNQYHRDVRDFPRSASGYYVGYHSLCTGGRNYRPKQDHEVGAHCNAVVDGKSMNFQSLGLALGFDGDIEAPLPEDLANAKAQIKEWQAKYTIAAVLIHPHRKYQPNKTCYGSKFPDDWAQKLVSDDVGEMHKRLALLKQILAIYQQLLMLRAKLPSVGKALFGSAPSPVGRCCEMG